MAASAKMQWAVIRKVKLMLEAAEIDYALVDPEGTVLGNLDVRREGEPEVHTKVIMNDWVAETDYQDKVKALQPGEMLTFDIKDPFLVLEGQRSSRSNSFASSLGGLCKRVFGEDKYVLTREDGHFEVLRVE